MAKNAPPRSRTYNLVIKRSGWADDRTRPETLELRTVAELAVVVQAPAVAPIIGGDTAAVVPQRRAEHAALKPTGHHCGLSPVGGGSVAQRAPGVALVT